MIRGLENLGQLAGLKQLYMGGGSYTDAGVANLRRLTGLKDLGMSPRGCTAACLAALSDLKLETLSIDGSDITDEWLDRIGTMKSLRLIVITSFKICNEAIGRLRGSLSAADRYINGRQQ